MHHSYNYYFIQIFNIVHYIRTYIKMTYHYFFG